HFARHRVWGGIDDKTLRLASWLSPSENNLCWDFSHVNGKVGNYPMNDELSVIDYTALTLDAPGLTDDGLQDDLLPAIVQAVPEGDKSHVLWLIYCAIDAWAVLGPPWVKQASDWYT